MADTVDVIAPDGQAGSMSAAELAQRVAAGEKWQQESAQAREQREFNEQAGLGTMARVAAENAASAATLGGYDVAAAHFGGDEYRKGRELAEGYAPKSAVGGKVIGLALPALMSGGASVAAEGAVEGGAVARGLLGLGRAVTAPVRGVAHVAEHLAGEVLPAIGLAGKSAAGRVALHGLKAAAGGAAEGALFGAGHAVSETALAPGGDYSHLAEHVLAGAKEGALFGAALGGALNVGGAAVARAGSSLAERIGDLRLDSLAAKSALKAVAADGRAARELVTGGEAEALGTRMLKDDIVAARRSYEEMGARAQAVKAEARSSMHDSLSILDEAGAAPILRPTLEKVRTEVIAPLARSTNAESQRIAKAISAPLAKAEAGELSFGQLQELRDAMHPATLWGSATPPAALQQGVAKIRGELDNTLRTEVQRAFAEATPAELHAVALKRALSEEPTSAAAAAHADAFIASARDGGAAKAFADSDLSYRAARLAEDQIAKRAASGGAGSSAGLELTSNISALSAAKALMHGNPLGMAAGIATSAASKYFAKHGKTIVADLAYRAAQADLKIAGKVRAFVGGGAEAQHAAISEAVGLDVDHALGRAAHESRQDAFERTAKSVRAGVNPEAMAVDAEAPQTGNAMRAVLQRGMAFLQTKLPAGAGEQRNPLYAAPPPSPESVAKFAQYTRAVKDPLSVLDSLRNGTASHEEIETLEHVYPQLYAQIKGEITSQLIARKTPVDHARRIQIGVMFGLPADPALEIGNYQVIQTSYQVTPTGTKQSVTVATKMQPGKLSGGYTTGADALEGQELGI